MDALPKVLCVDNAPFRHHLSSVNDATKTVKPAPTTAEMPEIQAVSDWLVAQGLDAPDPIALHSGFCERVVALGVPLLRGVVAVRTLHPRIDAVSYIWRRSAVPMREFLESTTNIEAQQGPFGYVLANQMERWRRRLDDGRPFEFPIFAQLRAQEGTDYLVRAIQFDIGPRREPTGMISSWVTDRLGGFTGHDLAVLERLLPRYALVVKALLARQIAVNVLDTYVGHDAGQRILAGEIKRGHLDSVNAVIVYADLRDFTEVSDRTPNKLIAPMLDAYFDVIVAPVVRHGGQVLKFLGDGCLMIFRLADMPRGEVCATALTAAAAMRDGARALNARRRAVGAADRLDFTVVGPAVNEASRIEPLCKQIGRNVLVSETLARAAIDCRHRLEPVGRHSLRGVREPQELFALRDGA
jgi:adenylate cyclase